MKSNVLIVVSAVFLAAMALAGFSAGQAESLFRETQLNC